MRCYPCVTLMMLRFNTRKTQARKNKIDAKIPVRGALWPVPLTKQKTDSIAVRAPKEYSPALYSVTLYSMISG